MSTPMTPEQALHVLTRLLAEDPTLGPEVDRHLATYEDRSETFCSAELVVRHEKFGCLEKLLAGERPHPLPHRGSYVSPPCRWCRGLDCHADGCPEIGGECSNATLEVTWGDDGVLVLVEAP